MLLRIVPLPPRLRHRNEEEQETTESANSSNASELPPAVSLPGHRRGVHALCVRGTHALSASSDSLRLWDLRGGSAAGDDDGDATPLPLPRTVVLAPGAGAEVCAAELRLHPGGSPACLLCGDRGGAVSGFDAVSGTRTLRLATGDGAAGALCLLDAHTLVVGSATRARVYDLRSESDNPSAAPSRGVATLRDAHARQNVSTLCAPPAAGDNDGAGTGCVLSGGGDGAVLLWDARAWQPLQQYAASARTPVTSLAADATRFAAGFADGRAAAWRL